MTKRTPPFSPEVRERAVRMVLEHQGVHDSQYDAIRSIAAKIGCSGETLRNWIRQAERDQGQRAGPTTDGSERVEEWRWSYKRRPPNGESLMDTIARVVPFHLRHVQPATMCGPTLVVGHGNALRDLVMALEGLGRGDVECRALATGAIWIYEFAPDTTIALRRTID